MKNIYICDESKRYINIHEISLGITRKTYYEIFYKRFFMLEKEAKKLMFVSFKVLLFIQNVNLFLNLFLKYEKIKFFGACI